MKCIPVLEIFSLVIRYISIITQSQRKESKIMWISKWKYEFLKKTCFELQIKLDRLEKDLKIREHFEERYQEAVKRHNRILCNSIMNGIGYLSESVGAKTVYTYIYYNLNEYNFNDLYLCNPEFTISEQNNMIINVKDIVDKEDERKVIYYTLDLKNESFVCAKEDVIWKKE